jgi:hypothetical protein
MTRPLVAPRSTAAQWIEPEEIVKSGIENRKS